jgi:hypothetical protein
VRNHLGDAQATCHHNHHIHTSSKLNLLEINPKHNKTWERDQNLERLEVCGKNRDIEKDKRTCDKWQDTKRDHKSLQVAGRLLSKVNGEIESFLQVPSKVMRQSQDKSDWEVITKGHAKKQREKESKQWGHKSSQQRNLKTRPWKFALDPLEWFYSNF